MLNSTAPGSEHHGIEHLAAEGRKVRQTTNAKHSSDQVAEALVRLEEGASFLISGNFEAIDPGYRLIVIKVPADTPITEIRGQIVDPVDDALVQRILQQWVKARAARVKEANRKEPSIPF